MRVNKFGFTIDEQRVHNALMDCYAAYKNLPEQHPDELKEFGLAIHLVQGLLATRIARRHYPKGWPDHSIEEG